MLLTVEAVSKNGKGMLSGGKWYNRDKSANFQDFSSLRKGTKVDVDANDNWIKSLTLVDGASESHPPENKTSTPDTKSTRSADLNLSIIRQTAVKAVFGGPLAAELLKTTPLEETEGALQELTRELVAYVLTGNFDPNADSQD